MEENKKIVTIQYIETTTVTVSEKKLRNCFTAWYGEDNEDKIDFKTASLKEISEWIEEECGDDIQAVLEDLDDAYSYGKIQIN